MKRLLFLFFLALTSCGTPPKQQETAALHLQLGVSLIQKENYPEALKEMLIGQDIDPRNPYVQSYLGFIYFIRERYDLSEEHYRRAVTLKPDFTDAKNNLARIYIETSQNKLAEKLLKEVLQDYTYSDFPRAYLNLGILEFNRKNYKNALFYLQKSVEKDRENCLAHVYIGRTLLDRGDAPQAVDQLNRAVHFCENLQIDDAYYYSAIALFRNDQKDLAAKRFEDLLKIYSSGKNSENAKKMLDVIRKGDL